MKQISWKKFDSQDDNENEEFEENKGMINGIVLQQISHGSNSYDDYNMFVGHCNFYLTQTLIEKIFYIEGTEALDVLSPYRFRVAVGKLFVVQDVLDNIEKQLIEG